MKHILIDQSLYLISDKDFERIQYAEGDCCGSCNEHTLQNLRNVLLDVIMRYDIIELAITHIPKDQFSPKPPIETDMDELPF